MNFTRALNDWGVRDIWKKKDFKEERAAFSGPAYFGGEGRGWLKIGAKKTRGKDEPAESISGVCAEEESPVFKCKYPVKE